MPLGWEMDKQAWLAKRRSEVEISLPLERLLMLEERETC